MPCRKSAERARGISMSFTSSMSSEVESGPIQRTISSAAAVLRGLGVTTTTQATGRACAIRKKVHSALIGQASGIRRRGRKTISTPAIPPIPGFILGWAAISVYNVDLTSVGLGRSPFNAAAFSAIELPRSTTTNGKSFSTAINLRGEPIGITRRPAFSRNSRIAPGALTSCGLISKHAGGEDNQPAVSIQRLMQNDTTIARLSPFINGPGNRRL